MLVTVVSPGGGSRCAAPASYLLRRAAAEPAAAAATPGLPCNQAMCPRNFFFFLQWELVEGMDLLDYLNSRGGVLAEAEAAPLFAQLVHGMRLIHEAGLVHRGAACCGGKSCQCHLAYQPAVCVLGMLLSSHRKQPPTRCPCPATSPAPPPTSQKPIPNRFESPADVKGENVMLEAGTGTLKIIDFG